MTRDEDHFRTAEEADAEIGAILALPTFEEQREAWKALLREDPGILQRHRQIGTRLIEWGVANFDALNTKTSDVPYPHLHREREE